MFLTPLLFLLGLTALDTTVHAGPLTENEILPLDTVDAAAAPAAAAADAEVKLQRGSCPQYWFYFNGHCYKFVAANMIWAEAERNCVSYGGNLVSIHSADENNFVRTLIRNFDHKEGYTWIGLTDIHQEGRWFWSDGSSVSFTKWYPGEPNNHKNEDCVYINHKTATYWNDYRCSGTFDSVCKK